MEIGTIRNLTNVSKDVLRGDRNNNGIQSCSERYAGSYLKKGAAVLTLLITVPVVIGIWKDISRPTKYNQPRF